MTFVCASILHDLLGVCHHKSNMLLVCESIDMLNESLLVQGCPRDEVDLERIICPFSYWFDVINLRQSYWWCYCWYYYWLILVWMWNWMTLKKWWCSEIQWNIMWGLITKLHCTRWLTKDVLYPSNLLIKPWCWWQ